VVGEHAPGFVAAKDIILKVESSLRGIDQLGTGPKSICSDVENAKPRIARVLARRGRKLTAEIRLRGWSKRYGFVLRVMSAGLGAGAGAQRHRYQQDEAEPNARARIEKQRRRLLEPLTAVIIAAD
jgi:hypothetical protein